VNRRIGKRKREVVRHRSTGARHGPGSSENQCGPEKLLCSPKAIQQLAHRVNSSWPPIKANAVPIDQEKSGSLTRCADYGCSGASFAIGELDAAVPQQSDPDRGLARHPQSALAQGSDREQLVSVPPWSSPHCSVAICSASWAPSPSRLPSQPLRPGSCSPSAKRRTPASTPAGRAAWRGLPRRPSPCSPS
jgi:hypothetical protein